MPSLIRRRAGPIAIGAFIVLALMAELVWIRPTVRKPLETQPPNVIPAVSGSIAGTQQD